MQRRVLVNVRWFSAALYVVDALVLVAGLFLISKLALLFGFSLLSFKSGTSFLEITIFGITWASPFLAVAFLGGTLWVRKRFVTSWRANHKT